MIEACSFSLQRPFPIFAIYVTNNWHPSKQFVAIRAKFFKLWIVWDYSHSKQKAKQYIQKTSLQNLQNSIKILAYPGLPWSGFEQPKELHLYLGLSRSISYFTSVKYVHITVFNQLIVILRFLSCYECIKFLGILVFITLNQKNFLKHSLPAPEESKTSQRE